MGGCLSDQFGRKKVLAISLFMNGVGGFASAAAPNVGWLLLFRLIAGVGKLVLDSLAHALL